MTGELKRTLPSPPRMEIFARTFYCPDLKTQDDETIVQQTLKKAPGIESVTIDRALHTVWISTANQSGVSEAEAMLSDAGYTPEDLPPSSVQKGSFYAR